MKFSVKCKECGAPVAVDTDQLSDICPFCENPLTVDIRDVTEIIISQEKTKQVIEQRKIEEIKAKERRTEMNVKIAKSAMLKVGTPAQIGIAIAMVIGCIAFSYRLCESLYGIVFGHALIIVALGIVARIILKLNDTFTQHTILGAFLLAAAFLFFTVCFGLVDNSEYGASDDIGMMLGIFDMVVSLAMIIIGVRILRHKHHE